MNRKGFTIVELLVVIAVVAILAGAITMGVSGMMYKARRGRAIALRNLVKSGIETYYARNGEWPSPINNKLNDTSGDRVELTPDECDTCIREIVKVSVGSSGNPVFDPSGLFVCRSSSVGNSNYGCTDIHRNWQYAIKHLELDDNDKNHKCNGKCTHGMNFTDAVKKNSKGKIPLAQMSFGYPGPNYGRFCRFRIYYNLKSDTIDVSTQKATEHSCGEEHPNGFTDEVITDD